MLHLKLFIPIFLFNIHQQLPEINSVTSEVEENGKPASLRKMLKVFLIQNLGLLTGFAIMLILALYDDKIHI